MKFDEPTFIKELGKFEYYCELDYDEDTHELTHVYMYPKQLDTLFDKYRVDFHVIEFMYENGFKVGYVVFNEDKAGGFVSFYRVSDEE